LAATGTASVRRRKRPAEHAACSPSAARDPGHRSGDDALGPRCRIIAVDRERTVSQGLADLGFVLCFLLWVYEVLAFTLPLGFHLVPTALRGAVLDAGFARAAGVLVVTAGLAVYGLALHAFGSSWRLGIDRNRPGALVTAGIFGHSRNPVYLGLALLAVGVFLILGRLELLVLAIVFLVYFRFVIRREGGTLPGRTLRRCLSRVRPLGEPVVDVAARRRRSTCCSIESPSPTSPHAA
jgi:protein-S-isoprenylcysteine O-methyltransferase Ste14